MSQQLALQDKLDSVMPSITSPARPDLMFRHTVCATSVQLSGGMLQTAISGSAGRLSTGWSTQQGVPHLCCRLPCRIQATP